MRMCVITLRYLFFGGDETIFCRTHFGTLIQFAQQDKVKVSTAPITKV